MKTRTMYDMSIDAFIACATQSLKDGDCQVREDGGFTFTPITVDEAIEHAWKMAGEQMDSETKKEGERLFRGGARC